MFKFQWNTWLDNSIKGLCLWHSCRPTVFDRLWINGETGRRPATSPHRLRVSEQHTLTSLRKHLIHQPPGSAASQWATSKKKERRGGGAKKKTTGFCILAPPWQLLTETMGWETVAHGLVTPSDKNHNSRNPSGYHGRQMLHRVRSYSHLQFFPPLHPTHTHIDIQDQEQNDLFTSKFRLLKKEEVA